MSGQRRVEVVLNSPGELTFPEQSRELHFDRPSVGLCFAGGGSRALSASMGYYRALTELGLLDRVRVISSVSGGTWASFLYTYYCAGAQTDAELLGPQTAPEQLRMKDLREPLPRSCMGFVVTQSVTRALLAKLGGDLRGRELYQLWNQAMGEVILSPFGLYDPARPRTITLDERERDSIIARQGSGSDLRAQDFVTARPGRPFLVANASLLGPYAVGELASESPVRYEFSPLYVGSAAPIEVLYEPKHGDPVRFEVGGGCVEPFGAGGPGPARLDASGPVSLAPPSEPCTTEFIVGTSSAAPAGVLAELPTFSGAARLVPRAPYWPPRAGPVPATRDWEFSDGGTLENYGLITLLLRKLDTVVVFMNNETPLSLDYDPTGPVHADDIDNSLPPLFGVTDPAFGEATQHNQVFARADYAGVVAKLQAAKRAGGATLAVTEHETLSNEWWGVDAGHRVRVCWVAIERSPVWESRLGDRSIRRNIERGNRCRLFSGPFKRFPHYGTVSENGAELIELTDAQVKLLADLCCWSLCSERERLAPLFA